MSMLSSVVLLHAMHENVGLPFAQLRTVSMAHDDVLCMQCRIATDGMR